MISRRRTRAVKHCLKAALAAVAFSLALPLAGSREAVPVGGEASAQQLRPWQIDFIVMSFCLGHICYAGNCCEPGDIHLPF